MTSFEIWHRDTFRSIETFPVGFTHVANVNCEHVEAVFQSTNNIESSWLENPEVENVFNLTGARSTSVGDVIVDSMAAGFDHVRNEPIWRRWMVSPVGLTRL